MFYYMGDDFKEFWDDPMEEDGNTRDKNAQLTFNAIENVIRTHMGISGNANFSNLESAISVREVIKMAGQTPLQELVANSCHKILNHLSTILEFTDIFTIEGQYEKYQFPTRENSPTLELWFDEISDTKGDLVLTSPDTEHRARFTISDEEIEGEEKTIYRIDDDMGKAFMKNCFDSVYAALNSVVVK